MFQCLLFSNFLCSRRAGSLAVYILVNWFLWRKIDVPHSAKSRCHHSNNRKHLTWAKKFDDSDLLLSYHHIRNWPILTDTYLPGIQYPLSATVFKSMCDNGTHLWCAHADAYRWQPLECGVPYIHFSLSKYQKATDVKASREIYGWLLTWNMPGHVSLEIYPYCLFHWGMLFISEDHVILWSVVRFWRPWRSWYCCKCNSFSHSYTWPGKKIMIFRVENVSLCCLL